MFSRIFLAIFTVILASEPLYAEARFPFLGETTQARVNVRAGGNNNFETVATLEQGARVIVLAKNFQWYKVRLPENAKAYIYSSYVSVVAPQVGEVTGDRVNVRAAPNTNATTLGQLKKGDKFFIKGNQGEWTEIKPVDALSGWIHESLLVFKSQDVPSQTAIDATAIARKALEIRAQKTALLKKLDNGQVECTGVLTRTETGYKVVRENTAVCLVDGPASLLETFAGGQVIVQGAPKEVQETDEAVGVLLSKIRRSF